MSRIKRLLPAIAIALLAIGAGILISSSEPVEAADHTDPPDRVTAGDATDIGDVYAWHDSGAGTLTMVLTIAGPVAPVADQTGTYDTDALYGIHIDNNGDNAPNFDIWVKFGQNDLGDWGVQVEGLPGTTGPVVGAVETEIAGEANTKVWAGLRDDPFFMDLQGFQDTVAMGSIEFDPTRDFFAGLNITAIVIEVPLTAAQGGGDSLGVWATSASL